MVPKADRRWGGCVGLVLATLGTASSGAQLTLRTDADCDLQLKGRAAGKVLRAQPRELKLDAGPWELRCQGSDGPQARVELRGVLKPDESVQMTLPIRWRDLGANGLEDRRTRLNWMRSDSGRDTDWPEAKAWCASQGDGWRLPTRKELESLFDSGLKDETVPCFNAKCRVPASFQLSASWQWTGDASAEDSTRVWYLYLSTGHPQTSTPDYRLNARALCVRPAP
jgi:hypothetical protein